MVWLLILVVYQATPVWQRSWAADELEGGRQSAPGPVISAGPAGPNPSR
jgi:hypothetical protein